MPGRSYTPKREVIRGPKFDDMAITKLINNVMLDGKKGTAQKVVYKASEDAEEATNEEAPEVLYKALNGIMSVLEIRGRWIGGATYQVPMEVRPERRQTLGSRWLVLFARKHGEKTMAGRLVKEILDISNGLGANVKREERMHRTAEVNRAFAHYRW